MAQGYSLKDQLFNADKTRYLAGLFQQASPAFDGPAFTERVMSRLAELELKQRMAWIADCLGYALPGSLPDLAPVLCAALPPPLDPNSYDDDFGDFIFAPLGEFVVSAGLEEYPDLSLDLLEQITQRFSMEWAIRPFLNRWPDLVMGRMHHWATHPSSHVRRLVSEGTRPRLPWGQAVGLALEQPLDLLDVLHSDRARFVTRSVANHLNDITKKDPDLALDRLAAWQVGAQQDADELDWMTRHALRGLIKAGHPRAMKMLGFDPKAAIEVLAFNVPHRVAIGKTLRFAAQLRAAENTGALVDYVLWRRLANGKLAPKVFKLKQVQLQASMPSELTKAHRLKGDATTFRLFPGTHRIELQVNGRVLAEAEFELTAQV
jgi:3-methyladenine DNA glycosylase AlkC